MLSPYLWCLHYDWYAQDSLSSESYCQRHWTNINEFHVSNSLWTPGIPIRNHPHITHLKDKHRHTVTDRAAPGKKLKQLPFRHTNKQLPAKSINGCVITLQILGGIKPSEQTNPGGKPALKTTIQSQMQYFFRKKVSRYLQHCNALSQNLAAAKTAEKCYFFKNWKLKLKLHFNRQQITCRRLKVLKMKLSEPQLPCILHHTAHPTVNWPVTSPRSEP